MRSNHTKFNNGLDLNLCVYCEQFRPNDNNAINKLITLV